MNKKVLAIVLTLVLLAVMVPGASAAGERQATPTAATVMVDGRVVAFDAYNIDGNNYFKLRDLAYTLNGTAKQFSVEWDGDNNAINLTGGKAYEPDGSEMAAKGTGAKRRCPQAPKFI